jgi:putative heme-binding domain-containing protein
MRTLSFLFAIVLVANYAPAQVASPETIAAGKKLFAGSCSVGYCHGAEGRAGRGPRLRDREWDRNYLFKVIDDGIPNSSMPAWRGRLSDSQITSIVAYILSISKEVKQEGSSAQTRGDVPPRPEASAANDTSGGGVMGNASAGKALFFDATNERNCGVCHKAAGTGGEAGPDLTRIATQPARDILKRILVARGSDTRKAVEIVTKDGETLRGVLVEENASGLRLYDLTSAGPPVARTINLADIAQRRSVEADIAHENFAGTYTVRQLLDIVTYLKSAETPAKVRLEDLF